MKIILGIYCLICFASCYSIEKKAEIKAVYDEPALWHIVQNSVTQNNILSLKLLDSLLTAASHDSVVFHKTVNYLAKFYADPNSSLRDEIFYDQILKAQMDSKWYTTLEKNEVIRKFHLLHQNDLGNPANDFTYRTPTGQRKRMYSTEADNLLLFFYNPECSACKEIASALKNSLTITQATGKGKLKILCVYTDKDLSVWYRNLHEFPLQWLHGRDEDEYLYKNSIYDLKAIPTLYLLDRNKKVVLKDCTSIEELERNLQ